MVMRFAVCVLVLAAVASVAACSRQQDETSPARQQGPEGQPTLADPPASVTGGTDIATLRRLAGEGSLDAQYGMGFLYQHGQGVEPDNTQAAAWYQQAADQGHVAAQSYLASMYADGEGVPQDDAQAVAWYRKAADQGYAAAQFGLGFMYDRGRGVPQDFTQAVAWVHRAADQGLAEAQNYLAAMYVNGRGVQQDFTEAVAWMRRAADQGHAGAQYGLSVLYERQDRVEAHMWLILAASHATGNEQEEYAQTLEARAQQMSAAQLAEAQRRAVEWQAAFEQRLAD